MKKLILISLIVLVCGASTLNEKNYTVKDMMFAYDCGYSAFFISYLQIHGKNLSNDAIISFPKKFRADFENSLTNK